MIEPAWKCREGSRPGERSSELTDQAVTIRDSSYQETHSGLDSTRMGADYNKATNVLVTTSEVESLGQTSLLQQLLPGLPAALHIRVICALSPGKVQSSGSTSSLGPGGSLQSRGSLTGFSGALCAGGAAFTDGLLRNTHRLTHKRPLP